MNNLKEEGQLFLKGVLRLNLSALALLNQHRSNFLDLEDELEIAELTKREKKKRARFVLGIVMFCSQFSDYMIEACEITTCTLLPPKFLGRFRHLINGRKQAMVIRCLEGGEAQIPLTRIAEVDVDKETKSIIFYFYPVHSLS